ncbi:putative Rad51 recA bacterial DNA recombination protein [Trypanosoma vivax]|nr:putative Rad51 recA bacterial DNA recombination protein [Trypanosoma vivax]
MVDDCSTVKFSASCDASPELPLPDGMLTQELVTAEDCSTVRLCDSVCEPSEEMCVSDGVATQLIFSGEDSSLGPRPAHDGSLTPEPVLPSQCLGWQAEPPSEGRLADVLVKLHAAEQNIPNLNAVGFLLKSPWEVSQQLNISLDDVALLYQYLSATVLAGPNTLLYPVSVAECFTSRKRSIISTGSECLDRALAGGLACGTITEVTGASGSGKTALALHLAMRLACENDTMPGPHRTLWITTDYLAFPSARCGILPVFT